MIKNPDSVEVNILENQEFGPSNINMTTFVELITTKKSQKYKKKGKKNHQLKINSF